MADRFLKRIPKTPQDLERFYLDLINMLKDTFVTLEDVETLQWALHNDANPHPVAEATAAGELSMTMVDFISNDQQFIRDLELRINGLENLLSFERSNEQRLTDLDQAVQDSQTLFWMEA